MRIRKSYMTLMEVLIAMGLLSLLLTSVFGFWSYTSAIQDRADSARRMSFQQLYVQHRLESVMPHIIGIDNEKKIKAPLYISQEGSFKGESLVFVYDNGVIAEPEFANEVLGRLFIDHQNRLVLMFWPILERDSRSNPPMHKEILLENVAAMRFEFFKPPKRDASELKIKPEEALGGWQSFWNRKEETLPTMMKIHITMQEKEDRTITFAYLLIHTNQPILYTK